MPDVAGVRAEPARRNSDPSGDRRPAEGGETAARPLGNTERAEPGLPFVREIAKRIADALVQPNNTLELDSEF